ncbi:zona pellucida-binding protein 2 [Phaenicophaeus curvirostris]|uniref:zona pellucida-binding protein 2 n=1 Tax=Phaenicophaeus curvirostris TaxID=33595 RepID=UPI0037F0F3C1
MSLLATVVAVVSGWGTPTGARPVPGKQHAVDLVGNEYIYGDAEHTVSVYVKVFTNSPFLACMDLAHSQEDLIDSKYLWIAPDGKKLQGQRYGNLSEMGTLMVMGFKESLSGAYTCTLSHKILETTTGEEREVFNTYKFMVYAYREADHAYQVFVRFTTKGCKLKANHWFFKKLKIVLSGIISDLKCQIVEPSYECHSVKKHKHSLLHELFVTFKVNPFAPGWEEICYQVAYDCEDATNRRVQEARDRIEEFFHAQAYVLKHKFHTLPAIHYVDKSFSVIRIDSCRPGFGKNSITHKDCAGCCVVCDPGTYSPNNEVTCQTCQRPRVKQYGARSC